MHCPSFTDSPSLLRTPTARQCFMHRVVLILFLCALCLAIGITGTATPAHATTTPDLAAIDSYIEARIQEQHIPGLALGIVHGTDIIHVKGFGSANSAQPATEQTVFSIGSLTKSFTAVAMMQLVEAGKLDLDAPVQQYLPWFRVADQATSARITLRHLLTHSSGLPRDADTTEADSLSDANALETRLRNLNTVELAQPLGTYGYSNVGYQVLAMVIQQITGQSYEDYVRQHIFAPLAMQHSFATLSEAAQHNLAAGYHYWFGLPVAAALPTYRTGPGNGGLFSNAEDMSHYLIAHLNQGRFEAATLLSPAGIAELHRPAVPRPDGAYAMGWGVQTVDGVTRLTHSGQTYNYMAKMILVPDSQWGVVVLQNSQYMVKLATGDYNQDTIADGVVAMLIDRPLPSPTSSILPLLAYGVLGLMLIVQMTGIVRSIALLRRWQRQPEQRPHGARSIIWRIAVPFTLNAVWAMLMLIGLPATNDLTTLAYQIPDFTYTLLASGLVALIWSIIRTLWAWIILRQARAARANGVFVVQD